MDDRSKFEKQSDFFNQVTLGIQALSADIKAVTGNPEDETLQLLRSIAPTITSPRATFDDIYLPGGSLASLVKSFHESVARAAASEITTDPEIFFIKFAENMFDYISRLLFLEPNRYATTKGVRNMTEKLEVVSLIGLALAYTFAQTYAYVGRDRNRIYQSICDEIERLEIKRSYREDDPFEDPLIKNVKKIEEEERVIPFRNAMIAAFESYLPLLG